MEKTNFWHDASKYGALLGIEEIVFTLLTTVSPGFLVMLLNWVVFVTLLFLFTRRRVRLYGGGANAYSYEQCMKFIVIISLFAGVLMGVYEIFAHNIFFVAKYKEALDNSMGMLMQINVPGFDMTQKQEMLQRMLFSPFWVVFASIVGLSFKGGFFGLFVAAFTRREPSPFAGDNAGE